MALPFARPDAARAQIRLLDMMPWKRDSDGVDHLTCKWRVVSLDDQPLFAALSYVWGDTTDRREINMDGEVAFVTVNLYDALRWYDSWRPDLPVWADAVCINQNDTREKNEQVQMMTRIYGQAAHVVCWLGPSTPMIDVYFKHGPYPTKKPGQGTIAKKLSESAIRARGWLRNQSRAEQSLQLLQIFSGATELTSLSYFRRMWTFQEALLPGASKAVYVVGGTIRHYDPWTQDIPHIPKVVIETIQALRPQDPNLDPTERAILELVNDKTFLKLNIDSRLAQDRGKDRRWTDAGQDGFDLWRLMIATRSRHCQDPRDKIFALVGLLPPVGSDSDDGEVSGGKYSDGRRGQGRACAGSVPDGEKMTLAQARRRYLTVDYSKGHHAVVLDALYYMFHYEDPKYVMIDVLARYTPCGPRLPASTDEVRKQQGNHQTSEHPSWLPDVSSPPPFMPIDRGLLFKAEAMGSQKVSWLKVQDLGHTRDWLEFEAKTLGKVRYVGVFPAGAKAVADAMVELLQQAGLSKSERYPEPPRLELAFDLHAGEKSPASIVKHIKPQHNLQSALDTAIRKVGDIVTLPSHASRVEFWCDVRDTLSTQHQTVENRGAESKEARYLRYAEALCRRALVVLHTGRFALCRDVVVPGDLIVASTVWRQCLVLRAINGTVPQTHHNLVDMAFVDGSGTWGHLDEELFLRLRKMAADKITLT